MTSGPSRSVAILLPYIRAIAERDIDPRLKEPRGCRYILGHTNAPMWRFCQAPRRRDSSYCAEHHARCYTLKAQEAS